MRLVSFLRNHILEETINFLEAELLSWCDRVGAESLK
jgi:hypothetical protein